MTNQDMTVAFVTDKSPGEVFNAVNNVRGWWTENVEGNTEYLDDEFSVRFWDVHYSKQKLTEVVPGKKVVWLITESQLNFIENTDEWTGTRVVFDITRQGDKTELRFSHEGLNPSIECFKDCSNAWAGYITGSLYDLVTTGTGKPEKKED